MKKVIRISDLSIEPQLSRKEEVRRHSLSYRMRIVWLSLREAFHTNTVTNA